MATEEVKKARLMKLFNSVVFGFGKGLYDLFGDSAIATASSIGEDLIEEMEHEMGLEIHGEDPDAIMTELARVLEDEYGLIKDARFSHDGNEGNVFCQGCELWHATEDMLASGAQPFHCVPMMVIDAALNKRLGLKVHFKGITQDKEKHVCDIDFITN